MTRASGMGFDLAEGFQAVRAGQAQIEQNGVDSLGLQQAKGVLGGIGNMGSESEGNSDFAASLADGSFVVDDEEVEKVGAQDLRLGDQGTNSC